MKRAHFLSSIRLFKKHFTRFLTIFAVALVAVSFTSGLGEAEEQIKSAAKNVYREKNISDLYIKSKRITGFTDEERSYFIERFGEEKVVESFCYEFRSGEDIVRLIAMDLSVNDVDVLSYDAGSRPKSSREVLVERGSYGLKSKAVGETFSLSMMGFSADLTVSGVVLSPLYLYSRDNRSYQYEDENIDYVLFVDYSALSDLSGLAFSFVNDVYIALDESERQYFNAFSDEYEKIVQTYKEEITDRLGEDNASPLSLYENMGMYSLVSYAEKVGVISIVFVVFFLLVTLLVVYSAMNRLFAEERQQIACQKTLGYGDLSILNKYLFFDFIGTLAGGAAAYGLGLVLTKLIYNAFNLQYAMPDYPAQGGATYYLVCLAVVAAGTTLLTFVTGLYTVRQKPVTLLSHKAPKAGRKVIVERIPFLWNRLSFKHKSTVRNVLLFRSRFYMTVVSVTGSSVLVFSGLGLMNVSSSIPDGQTLITISLFLVVFSALLCALVIYNLTNINVSERCREIATLMVLGYSDQEVTGYVYREIYVMCAVGSLLGVPFGCLFVQYVFALVNIGSLSDIQWWTYLVTPLISMLFCFLSTRLLKRKITRTDMNASLKTLE